MGAFVPEPEPAEVLRGGARRLYSVSEFNELGRSIARCLGGGSSAGTEVGWPRVREQSRRGAVRLGGGGRHADGTPAWHLAGAPGWARGGIARRPAARGTEGTLRSGALPGLDRRGERRGRRLAPHRRRPGGGLHPLGVLRALLRVADGLLLAALGLVLGVGILRTFFKSAAAQAKLDDWTRSLQPYRQRLGITAMVLGGYLVLRAIA